MQLQVMQEDKLTAGAKVINPPTIAPADLYTKGVNTQPGGITFIDGTISSDMMGLRPLYQLNPDFNAQLSLIQDCRDAIAKTGYSNLFLMLTNQDNPQMTAAEIYMRDSEKMSVLGPVIERLEYEKLDKLNERTYAILTRAGVIQPPPQELQGADLKAEYINILAQAQRIRTLAPMDQFIGRIGNVAAVNPEVLDKVDFDEWTDIYGDVLSVPPSILRDEKLVAAIRQGRQQAQQQAQMAQAGMTAAQGAKTLSEADTGGNNALTSILGGGGRM